VQLQARPLSSAHSTDYRATMQAAYTYCRSSYSNNLLDAIKSCWEGLQHREDDMLDIVWFFKGRPWEVVDRYCADGALAQLENVGWLRRCLSPKSGALRVVVPAAVEDCIQIELKEKFERWQELAPEDVELVRAAAVAFAAAAAAAAAADAAAAAATAAAAAAAAAAAVVMLQLLV
jgi:hypothetical protein